MTRPCFLVVDHEYAGSISTRKLVIETAKLNVITAYSGAEAVEMLERFPNVDGIVLDAGIPDVPCNQLLHRFKQLHPAVPVVVIGTPHPVRCDGADHFLPSFEPAKLLTLLQRLNPEAQKIQEREVMEQPNGIASISVA